MPALIDWGRTLAYLTEMIRAAHPAPIAPEPRQHARALVGILGGATALCKPVELTRQVQTITETFHLYRAGDYRITVTQMGNVPVVLAGVTLGGRALLRGWSVGAEVVISEADVQSVLVLEFEAFWWTEQGGNHGP